MSSTIISPPSSLLFLNSKSKSKSKPLLFNPNPNFPSPKLLTNSNPKPHHIPIPKPKPKPLTPIAATKTTHLSSSSSSSSSDPQPQSLKSRLQNGETPLYGLFLCSFSPTLAEIAALAGYDFVVIDMEHGYGGISESLACLRALAATRTPAILRLPESTPAWAKKALDLGPDGLMFPMIETPQDAANAVSYCRYPPNGVRGAAHPIVRASGYGIDPGYLSNYEDELLIMCQVESEDALEKVVEIADVDGVDCVQMGPTDLSASMGYLWDPGHKKVKEVLNKAEKLVLENNKKNKGGAYLCGFAMPHDGPLDLKSRGYHMVSGAVDIGLFREAVLEDVRKFKLSLEMDEDGDSDADGHGSDDSSAEDKDGDAKYWSE